MATGHVFLLLLLIATSSPTRNEVAHLPAGLCYLYTGQFHLYHVNPPLARIVQAAPAACYGCNTAKLSDVPDRPRDRVEWHVAALFASENRAGYSFLFTLARLPGVLWSLAGLWVVRSWSRELYGPRAALLAGVLWCFDPNILAHAALATPDFPCAVACLAASFSFHKYLRAPSAEAAARSGVLLGLAQLTKFTALIDCLVWVVLAVIACRSASPTESSRRSSGRPLAHATVIVLATALVINIGYGCEGTLTPLGEFRFSSRALCGGTGEPGNRFTPSWAGGLPVPLPANYVRGIDTQQADFEGGRQSYLMGEWRDHGWWYFYLYALLVKTPPGTLALGTAGLLISFLPRSRRFDEIVVWLPAVAVFAVASAKTGYTMHFRYVLPALPLMVVGLSKVAETGFAWGRKAVWLLAAWSAVSSLTVLPHSLSYFSELAGGPDRGHEHLVDSNIDWGQDLYHFQAWAARHPEARPMGLAYSNFVPAKTLGVDFPPPPPDPLPGWYAVDIHNLTEPGSPFRYFAKLRPAAKAGYSIFIYRVTAEDAERVRREMAPPPAPGK